VRSSAYALVGRESSGKRAVVRCLLGRLRPQEGSVRVFGVDPRRNRWALRKRVRHVPPDEVYDAPRGIAPELVVREGNDAEGIPPGVTAVLVTSHASAVAVADRVGFMKEGRLLREEDVASLAARFRRIRYVNEMTEARAEYGNELDAFDAVRVKVRGWGVEAVVSNFDDATFEKFRAMEGVNDAVTLPMTLDEIFEAVVG
jgi:ABC-type multidrug transport system ATPase subunit